MKVLQHLFAVAIFAALGGGVAEATHILSEHFSPVEQARLTTNVNASFSVIGTTTFIRADGLPANWYISSSRDVPLTVAWSTPATSCKVSGAGAFGSENSGNFSQVWGIGGEFLGFAWSAAHDLTSLEHHWHQAVACDGSSSVIGCKAGRTVSYSLSVGGHCTNSDVKCAAGGSILLAATRDADEVETNCPFNCTASFNRCVSSCEAACANSVSSCGRCCECDCKDAIHEQNAACPAPQASCYAVNPKHPACL